MWASSETAAPFKLQIQIHNSYFIHAGCCEENANLLSVSLQLSVLIVTELQVALVFPIGSPPRVFGGVWPLQSSPIEFMLQFAFLELGTVCSTVLQRDNPSKTFIKPLNMPISQPRLRQVPAPYLFHLFKTFMQPANL